MIALLAVLLLFAPDCGTKRRGETTVRITKRAWADFKAGSFVKYKMTQSGMDMDYKLTLSELKGATAVLDYEITWGAGGATKNRQEQPADKGWAEKMGKEVKTRQETFTLNGRRLRCVVSEREWDMNGQKHAVQVWQCNDVPGLTVKLAVEGPSVNYSMELTEFEIAK